MDMLTLYFGYKDDLSLFTIMIHSDVIFTDIKAVNDMFFRKLFQNVSVGRIFAGHKIVVNKFTCILSSALRLMIVIIF